MEGVKKIHALVEFTEIVPNPLLRPVQIGCHFYFYVSNIVIILF